MAIKILANPTVRINNVTIYPKAGSVMVNDGLGDKKVSAVSSGGGLTDVAVSEDISTRIGKVKMSLPTATNPINYMELVRGWANIDLNFGNVITVSENGYTRTLTAGVLVGSPDTTFEVDGYFEIEFNGRPLV